MFRKDHYGKFIGLMCFYVDCYDCYDGAGDGVVSDGVFGSSFDVDSVVPDP